ncbi:MAG: alpha/beta hydrolase [Treponema sp.]|jgi:RTX toxin RtxA|nr:alpha/beta hydrolase [Treponema sp.]
MKARSIKRAGVILVVLALVIFGIDVLWRRPMRNHVLSRAFNEMSLGTDVERFADYDPRREQREHQAKGDTGLGSFDGCVIEAVEISTPSAILRGYLYLPPGINSSSLDELVIFFSGSSAPNAAEVGAAAPVYNRMGAAVLGVDYRGWGRSNNRPGLTPVNSANITEAGAYEDAREIYRYAVETLSVPPNRVILHGFSLGGAMASRTAANIAREAARAGNAASRLGGLVLQSSIRDMTSAAAGTLPLPKPLAYAAGWIGGLLTGGDYNTAAHLQRLAKYDPGIPLHFIGGSSANGDQLSLEITGLDRRVPAFTQATSYSGSEGHTNPGGSHAVNFGGGLTELEQLVRVRF